MSSGSDGSSHDVLEWDVVLVLAFWSFAVSFYGCVRQKRDRKTAIVFAFVYGVVCSTAALVAGASWDVGRASKRFPRPDLGALSILLGAFAVAVLCLVRLTAAQKFEGDVFDLDFGLLWSPEKGVTENRAMHCGFNTFTHFAQGCASYFLFPATEFDLGHIDEHLAVVGRIVSITVVFYPLYNLIKRLKKHGSHFAISSFFHNCMDWLVGFQLGISLGILGTVRDDSLPGILSRETRDSHIKGWETLWDLLDWARFVMGALLMMTTLVAAVQLWQTWDCRPVEVSRLERMSEDGTHTFHSLEDDAEANGCSSAESSN